MLITWDCVEWCAGRFIFFPRWNFDHLRWELHPMHECHGFFIAILFLEVVCTGLETPWRLLLPQRRLCSRMALTDPSSSADGVQHVGLLAKGLISWQGWYRICSHMFHPVQIGNQHIWRLVKITLGEFALCNPIWLTCREIGSRQIWRLMKNHFRWIHPMQSNLIKLNLRSRKPTHLEID